MSGVPIPVRIPAMKIRSITCFIDPSNPVDERKMEKAGEFLRIARPAFTQAGYEVESARLASVPFSMLFAGRTRETLPKLAQQLEQAAAAQGYAYVSLGPVYPDQIDGYGAIPEALKVTQNAFFAGSMTTADGEVSLNSIRQCAWVIKRASTITPDGFANLRYAALANVPAGSPFFPAAYHCGGEPMFALATEAADLAVTAFSQAGGLAEARRNLVTSVESHGSALTDISYELERASGVKFNGIDFSLAPFPDEVCSIGIALERLGVPSLGDFGSLTAAAILADTMDQAVFPRAGFCGLFLPVLEDAILARRVAEGSLGVVDLLLYSAVCGTGLDTIPLPGDTNEDQLSAILVDLASLSSRLGKPLTARLMPIPGKKAGEPTGFDFAYFANSRIMPIQAKPLGHHLSGVESFSLKVRPKR